MALSSVSPGATRIAILIAELTVFLVGTAFTAYFISHASALHFGSGEAPPPAFPVIVYDGDRTKPEPKHYRVLPWSDWEAFADGRPGASLLLPEPAATLDMGNAGEAAFVATSEGESRQMVELTWRSGGSEQQARYVAQARSIEARYLRTLGNQTFLMSVLAGFIAGLMVGRALRKRLLAVPGRLVS